MTKEITIIRIRKGINGFRYSACDNDGFWIGNFDRLSEVRNYWKREIRWGLVQLIRELDKRPDMSRQERLKKETEGLLKAYAKEVKP